MRGEALWRKGLPWVAASILQSFLYCTILSVLTPKRAFLQNRHAGYFRICDGHHHPPFSLLGRLALALWQVATPVRLSGWDCVPFGSGPVV